MMELILAYIFVIILGFGLPWFILWLIEPDIFK